MSLPPSVTLPTLAPYTIVPVNDDLYVPYFEQLYQDIAFSVNARDFNYFTFAITDTATNIPNLPNFGAFLVCVSGQDSTLPTKTVSLCKADATSAGSVTGIGLQAGTGAWAGFVLTITSIATNFQIAHNNTGITGNFNIRIVGTQG